jgi:protoheme IX farnesyltransferase
VQLSSPITARQINNSLILLIAAAATFHVYYSGMATWLDWFSGLKAIINIYIQSAYQALSALVAASLIAAVVIWRDRSLSFESRFSKQLVLVSVALVFTIASGFQVGLLVDRFACQGWPLCNGALPIDANGWIHLIHRGIVGATGLMLLGLFLQAWKSQRFQTQILVLITIAAALFFGVALLDAMPAEQRFRPDFITVRAVTTGLLLLASLRLTLVVGAADRAVESERLDAYQTQTARQRFKDFLGLTKPIIVLLLLVTTFTGMIVGAGGWPAGSTIVWTLIGGALAAGGSGAINQYIDRQVDQQMKRTARRPIASGRMTPAEGLAYGVGLCILAFYLLAAFTNLLAAGLAVFGMFYYVWLYSILLKKTTVQNIVIGGGAGAVPPLVGWAAATGSITLPAIMLFVIIFFWTPPHFWALALVRAKDYARGGIPMLPVVKGETETLRQILLYTLVLVALTLLAPLTGLGGLFYAAMALLSGIALTALSWRLKQAYTPKLAWKMYRYSSYYLAFLFLALVADVFVRI